MNTQKHVVIIGGGASGVLVAIHLLRQAKSAFQITIIENNAQLGQGIAYSTTSKVHLLNVPNQNMSAFTDNPNHFIDWLQQQDLPCEPFAFSPRSFYASYLQDTLKQYSGCQHIQQEAISLQPTQTQNNWQVSLADGQIISATDVVLALGVFFQPSMHAKYITNPWPNKIDSIPIASNIALIGSGLSTVDMLLYLKEKNWQGSITVLAKNGRLPLIHDVPSFEKKLSIAWPVDQTVRQQLHTFKNYLHTAQQQGYTWQAVVDSLRPYTQKIWQNWSETEKRRFVRHLRSKWDRHRHRVAPRIAEQITQLQAEQFFVMHKAKVDINSVLQLDYDYIIDCRGLMTNYRQASTLLKQLYADQIFSPGPLGRGIKTRGNGEVQKNLYAIGFALHGELWESIAVPELRSQAASIVESLLNN